MYVYYDDSPSATAYDNSSSYQSVGPITILTQLGSLNLSKDTAYLSGDTVVATVVDVDRNSLSSTQDQLTSALKITGATYSLNPDVFPILVETAVNSSTFVATFKTRTGTSSDDTVTPRLARAIQGGIINVIYIDTAPSSSSASKTLTTSSFDGTMSFDAESYSLGSYPVITLADAERNASNTTAESLLSDVFIRTTSANNTKVRMVETGADTGTFVGSINVASSGGTLEFSRIQAAEGDTLIVSYIDEVNTTDLQGR